MTPWRRSWLDPGARGCTVRGAHRRWLRRSAGAARHARPRARVESRYLQLPARSRAALRRAAAAAACVPRRRRRATGAEARGRVRTPALAARDDQRTQRLPGAARRASAGAAAPGTTDGRQRLGGTTISPDIRCCSMNCSTAACCLPSRTGARGRLSSSARYARTPAMPNGRWTPCATSTRRRSFRLLAQDLNGLLSVERLADHLSALADIVLAATLEHCWAQMHGQAHPPAAAICHRRLRQAWRQGTRLRVRPRPGVLVRGPR